MKRIWTFLLTFLLFTLGNTPAVLACATCRPNEGDPIAMAADMSVVFLGGLVMLILSLISSFFGYLYYRSRHPLIDPAQLIAEAEMELGDNADGGFTPRHP